MAHPSWAIGEISIKGLFTGCGQGLGELARADIMTAVAEEGH